MRSKEHAYDYRYFPDPDLLPLVLDPDWVERLRAELPELPDAKQARFVASTGCGRRTRRCWSPSARRRSISRRSPTGATRRRRRTGSSAICSARSTSSGSASSDSPIKAGQLGALIDLIADGTISGRIAKDVFAEMAETGAGPAAIVEAKGLRQVSDTGAIEAAVDAALAANPAQVAQYARNPKVLGFFVGQVMKATQGKANPALVNELLRKS